MKINKKECRKHSAPEIKFNKGNGMLRYEGINHIAYAAVKNIAGRRTLIMYFYNRQRVLEGGCLPEYTLFQFKDGYITYERDAEGKEKWREASIEHLAGSSSQLTKKCVFHRQKDERLVTRFCNIPQKEGFDALEALQSAILCVRQTKRNIARDKKIINRMKPIPATPRKFKGWVHREVMPHYIFYEYTRSKPMNGYCTACKRDILINEAKHNQTGKCPNCERSITFKATGKSSRVSDRDTVQVLQRVNEDELILRIYKVYHYLSKYREPKLTFWESTRIFIRKHKDTLLAETFYYSHKKGLLTHWIKGERPRFSYYQYSFDCDNCGHVFYDNLDEVLNGTSWQYSQLGRFYQISREQMEVLPYLYRYNSHPAIEYLVKMGLTNLASTIIYEKGGEEVINRNGKNLKETLGVGQEDVSLLKKLNVNTEQLALIHKLKEREIPLDENLIYWYRQHNIPVTENVLIPLRHTTPHKLLRYVEEQFEQMKDVETKYGGLRYGSVAQILSDYKDYLSMAEKMEYDFTKSIVLFPKNLKDAHDNASKLYDTKKSDIFNKIIREAYQELLNKYRFTKDGLTLIPPKTAKELVKEGHTLGHCVHSYVEKVANGECLVFFIRQTNNVKEPFYTLEIRNNKVTQIHGKGHTPPTKEVKQFLDLWELKKLKIVA